MIKCSFVFVLQPVIVMNMEHRIGFVMQELVSVTVSVMWVKEYVIVVRTVTGDSHAVDHASVTAMLIPVMT
jgi:methanogenic corrinoid protein MtbC1